jgi:nicotinate-nucleotide pyrophosphorylase (carboxylating)
MFGMAFNSAEAEVCVRLIKQALEEDLDGSDDLTSQAIIPDELVGHAMFVSRVPGVIAGLESVSLMMTKVVKRYSRSLPRDAIELFFQDGCPIEGGTALARTRGRMRDLLVVERTALNFLQRLSGIATMTRRFVDAVAGLPVQILDTRKTTPGWRLLEKYAVRCGGGHNHRIGLYDGILIKDNHLAALGGGPAAVTDAVRKSRQQVGHSVAIEVEVEDFAQLDAALAECPDIILLDNMSLEQMREAVRRRNAAAPDVKLEASGGVTLQTVRAIAETGVERISVGALTHSAPALDIALDYEKS